VASISLIASTASPVPPDTPNADPVAFDDVMFAASGYTHTLAALANDFDPDHDILAITAATDPANGSVGGIVRCADWVSGLSPQATCFRYTPDPGFRGVDAITYTIADGRGGSATATYYVAVDNPAIAVDAVAPASGPPAGGHDVVISGKNFMPVPRRSPRCRSPSSP
jgi:hypothetical protein